MIVRGKADLGELDELRQAKEKLLAVCGAALHALRSYQYGNAAPALAEEIADSIEATLAEVRGTKP